MISPRCFLYQPYLNSVGIQTPNVQLGQGLCYVIIGSGKTHVIAFTGDVTTNFVWIPLQLVSQQTSDTFSPKFNGPVISLAQWAP